MKPVPSEPERRGAQVRDRLSAWFGERLHADDVEIDDLVHHADGFSWQTYTLTARWHDESGDQLTQGYAVRREPEDGVLAPARTQTRSETIRGSTLVRRCPTR